MNSQAKGAILVLLGLGLVWAGLRLVADEPSGGGEEPCDISPTISGAVRTFERADEVNFDYVLETTSDMPAECTSVTEFLDADGNVVLSSAVVNQHFASGANEHSLRTSYSNDDTADRGEHLDEGAVDRIVETTVVYKACKRPEPRCRS